jgi:TPR repeat protein
MKDLPRAVEYYERSAVRGEPDGKAALGRCLVEGIGVRADPVRGAALLWQAAEEGNKFAEFTSARCLERGIGVAKNDRAAALYYKRAMDHGHLDAQDPYRR